MMIERGISSLLLIGITVVCLIFTGIFSPVYGYTTELYASTGFVEENIPQMDSKINTSKIYSPEVKPPDFSENPVGTLGALQELTDYLIDAADEMMRLIDSIFEMLGMEETDEVKNLKEVLEDGRSLVNN